MYICHVSQRPDVKLKEVAMSCSCGSPKCVCEEECYCHQINCLCSKCRYLEKLCSRCRLPFYVIIATKDDFERQVCCCDDQEFTFYAGAQSDLQTKAAARSNQLSVAPIRTDKCPRCDLPVLIFSTAEDYERRVQYCCCSNKNLQTKGPEISTEHETSNCASDHREVSADRQGRKILSRKIRTEKSSWQAKKVKEHSSNSAEDYSNTEMVDVDFPAGTSSPCPVRDNEGHIISCLSPSGDMSNPKNVNPDSNPQSQAGHTSKADESSTGNVSLFLDTSGALSPSALKPFSLGFFESHQNIRPNLPRPFPTLPRPIPGPPAFIKHLGRISHLQFKKWTSGMQQPLTQQKPEPTETVKMERWFETIQDVLNTSGELPDAETAAALDIEDKMRLEEKESEDKSGDQSGKQAGEEQAEQCRYPLRSRKTSHKSLADYKNGKDKDDNEPTTDTNRSTSLSKSHKESETD